MENLSIDLQALKNADPAMAAKVAQDYKRAMVALARKDPSWFCEYVLRHEKTGSMIRQGPVHKCIQKAMMEYDRNLIWTYPGCGKCNSTGTKIALADGTWAAVETLKEWTRVLTWDQHTGSVIEVTARSTDNGKKKCIKIILDDGVALTVTPNHPFMTDDLRWVPAEKLTTKDRIVCMRELIAPNAPETPESELPDEEAEILGYLSTGRVSGNSVVIRKFDKHPIWEDRRRSVIEAAGWLLVPHKRSCWLVVANNCAMTPAEFIKLHAKIKHGWVFDFKKSVYQLRISGLHRLLTAAFTAGFHGDESFGACFRLAGERAPYSFVVPYKETLEAFRRLLLKAGTSCIVDRGFRSTKHRKDSGGIWNKLPKLKKRNVWRIRLRTASDVSIFFPLKYDVSLARQPIEFHKIAQIERRGGPIQTWAVEVQESQHSFIAEGVLNHNTNQVSIGHVLWRLGKDPNITIGILCNSGKMANKVLTSLKTYIAESPELHDVFPNLKPGDIWAADRFTVDRTTFRKDPSVQALGLTGKFVGARLDGLILDDVDNVDTTLTDAAKKNTLYRVQSQALSRVDSGWVTAIGNVWADDDLMHTLAKKGWNQLRIPVMDAATGISNDPDNFPLDHIYQIRDVDQGPDNFAKLYMLESRSSHDRRFKREWIDMCLKKGIQQVLYKEGLENIPAGCKAYTGVDLGVKKKSSADPTVITTILEVPGDKGKNEYQILNIIKGRWDIQEITDNIRTQQRYFDSQVYIESNGAQDYLIQMLEMSGSRIPVHAFHTGRNKHDPTYGVEAIASEMSMGRWSFPAWDGTQATTDDEIDELIDEMLKYMPEDHTGDILMSLWIAREGARQHVQVKSGAKVEFGRLRLRR